MKTTIDIPESLLQRAKIFAKKKQLTLREVACEGIEHWISQEKSISTPYSFKGTRVQGKGLNPEFKSAEWPQIRAAIYGDRE
jgi:hypothetical protein